MVVFYKNVKFYVLDLFYGKLRKLIDIPYLSDFPVTVAVHQL